MSVKSHWEYWNRERAIDLSTWWRNFIYFRALRLGILNAVYARGKSDGIKLACAILSKDPRDA
jgi:hypothetical protein